MKINTVLLSVGCVANAPFLFTLSQSQLTLVPARICNKIVTNEVLTFFLFYAILLVKSEGHTVNQEGTYNMYIEKRIVTTWSTEEELTINSFREFLQEKMKELEHYKVDKELKDFYDHLDKLDSDLEYMIDNDYLMTAETNEEEEE